MDYEIRAKVRDRLVSLRIESGKTQKEIGDICGKSKTAVASWEQGQSLPDIETLYRLSLYYKKTMDYMFGADEKK